MFAFTRLDLARQFMLLSLIILILGMVLIGLWVGRQIETGVMDRTAAVTALYVDSMVSPHLQDLPSLGWLTPAQFAALDLLLEETTLGREIVSFKIWSPDGRLLYSPDSDLIGFRRQPGGRLDAALSGRITSRISDLHEPENDFERRHWDELIETYLPVRSQQSGDVIAAAEFYQTPDSLRAEVQSAQLRTWGVVAAATVVMYALLTGLVKRASATIASQQNDLREKVAQLSALADKNHDLHSRVRRSAARTTALNERYLRRISADLHDGPAQDMALALLRIEDLANAYEKRPIQPADESAAAKDFRTVKTAIASAIADLRMISSGLRLPELESLSPAGVVRRAVRDYEAKTRQRVEVSIENPPDESSMPTKITLYRLIQEALANGYRHARGARQTVLISATNSHMEIEVADDGDGFDLATSPDDENLGLEGMRERVMMLGGEFTVDTAPGQGARIHASINLDAAEDAG